jgi:2-keto-4-pentenoate hydratase/2-oxohepta-3-ene-1,7-dioic acid hydratase in catechol pathway
MRVARFSTGGDPTYGLVELASDNGKHPDTVAVISGDPLATTVQFTGERHALADVRLLAPVIPRSKIIAVGRNYAAHAESIGTDVPEIPMTFFKPNTAVVGPNEAIVFPDFTKKLGLEGELAVVIGRICKEVPPERAQEVIFGYTIANDVTARDLPINNPLFFSRSKGSDTFCPLGPWITCHLSLEEAQNLSVTTAVEGGPQNTGSTADMAFKIADIIAFVTDYLTLLPGDVVLTGAPAGVNVTEAGKTVSITIEGLGTLTNPVTAAGGYAS